MLLRAFEIEGDKETPIPFYWGTSGISDLDSFEEKMGTFATGQRQSLVVKGR